jgi:DNA-binding response OmpR family regulator
MTPPSDQVPILILTARDEEIDRVSGLTLCADDCLVKPFSPRELVARIEAILRRASPPPASGAPVLRPGGLIIDRRSGC